MPRLSTLSLLALLLALTLPSVHVSSLGALTIYKDRGGFTMSFPEGELYSKDTDFDPANLLALLTDPKKVLKERHTAPMSQFCPKDNYSLSENGLDMTTFNGIQFHVGNTDIEAEFDVGLDKTLDIKYKNMQLLTTDPYMESSETMVFYHGSNTLRFGFPKPMMTACFAQQFVTLPYMPSNWPKAMSFQYEDRIYYLFREDAPFVAKLFFCFLDEQETNSVFPRVKFSGDPIIPFLIVLVVLLVGSQMLLSITNAPDKIVVLSDSQHHQDTVASSVPPPSYTLPTGSTLFPKALPFAAGHVPGGKLHHPHVTVKRPHHPAAQ